MSPRRIVRLLSLGLVPALAFATGALSTPVSAAPAGHRTTVSFAESSATIANPARGFYRGTETHYSDPAGSTWTPLDRRTLESWRADGVTQALREFVIDYNGGADGAYSLTPRLLRLIDDDFAIARQAGVTLIVRFEYVGEPGEGWPPPTPYGDAPVARVLHNIRQLGPVLRRNADVIATVQQGFIGIWGEGYYTDYFADPSDPAKVSAKNWADRARVLKTLLRVLPKSVTVDVRTPRDKQMAFHTSSGTEGALTQGQAYSGSRRSRVGHHNDCFLASVDDYGTFVTDPLSLDEDYLGADSRYVPVGGETCAVNAPKSQWSSARSLMEKFHFSYLNQEYNTDVLDSWGAQGKKEATDRLGYRFVLRSASLPQRAVSGRRVAVRLTVANEGFAAPYRKTGAELVLTNARHTYRIPIRTDPRSWAAGETVQLQLLVKIPARVRSGHYRYALALPSPEPLLHDRSEYAIRTANVGTWDGENGWNWLHAGVSVR